MSDQRYGEEWRRDVSKLSKDVIIDWYRDALLGRNEALDELRNIVLANPAGWEYPDQFQQWAQSRARHTLDRIGLHQTGFREDEG